MAYKIVDPASLASVPGAHPAASPYDKRVSEALGISAFEVYEVELPPDAETVRHDHLDDDELPLRPGLFIAVSVESARQVRAGSSGLTFVALCGAPR